jgi:tRNA-dihydrouridine synthase
MPGLKERTEMIIRHMNTLVELKGEHMGVCEMRKHIAWYIKGLKNSTYVKERVFKIDRCDEVISLLREYAETEP